MVQTIGKVKLNLINCEISENKNPFETELLRIVRDTNVYEYRGIIEDKINAGDPDGANFLYNLSEVRGNIVRWLPIKKGDSVLEMEAECGAITAALNKLSENVTAFTSCGNFAEILAQRFSNCKNFCVYAGDFNEILDACKAEKPQYDWIIVRNIYHLKAALDFVSSNGRVVFITDNRAGMRNFAGAKSYGEKEFFEGIEGKNDSSFTLSGIEKLAETLGLSDMSFYYPYPDYRFTKSIFSDRRYPRVGELVDNGLNFYSDRMKLFSEKAAFDASVEDGSFKYYSNSYLVVFGKELNTEYVRFSNDRMQDYCIYTTIEDIEGVKSVRKYPVSEAAFDHIRKMASNYEKLNQKYAGSKLSINKCSVLEIGDRIYADFEYVKGTELSKLLDMCLEKNDLEGFYKLFDKYVELTGFNEDFGFADIDLVFSNILVNNDEWTLIDYEWCKEGKLPVKETAYRAIYCYLLEDKGRDVFNHDLILQKLVLSKEASEDIEEDEAIFQKSVTGKSLALGELSQRLQFKETDSTKMTVSFDDDKSIYRFRVYPGGLQSEFSEDTAFDINDAYRSKNEANALIPVTKDDNIMRIDPLDAPCLVVIREAKLEELDFPIENKKYVFSNGKRIGSDTFIFSTSDPNLYFNFDGFIHDEDTFLYLNLEITPLKEDTALTVSDHIKKLF